MNTDPFACLLRQISRAQDAIDQATVYRARCGRRRVFLSASDAVAYEDGYCLFPQLMPDCTPISPFSQGWLDADERDQAGVEALREAWDEREQRGD